MKLDDALDAVAVMECSELNFGREQAGMLPCAPENWFAVVTDQQGGSIAYFASEETACSFRLMLVNRLCNPNVIADPGNPTA